MGFPKNSAFYYEDQRARELREADLLHPPLRTPEDNQRIAAEKPRTVVIPVRDLEDIVEELRQLTLVNDIEDSRLQLDIEDLTERLSSFLPG